LDVNKILTKDNIRLAFDHYDVDRTGKITIENLEESFQRQGKDLNKEQIEKMIAECDTQKKGFIDFEVFSQLMRSLSRSSA